MVNKILVACIFSAITFSISSVLAVPFHFNELRVNRLTLNPLDDNGLRWNAITNEVIYYNNDVADTGETIHLLFNKTEFLQVIQET